MISASKYLLLSFLLLFLQAKISPGKFHIDASTHAIRDPYGRHTILHGVNAVYKVPPYISERKEFSPDDSFTDGDI